MEAFGAFFDDEWESLSKLFSNEEDNSDSHVNGSCNLFQSCGEIPSTFLCAGESNGASDHNESNLFIPYDTNLHSISQDSSNSSEIENHQGTTGVNLFDDESMDFYTLMNCKKDNSTMPIFSDDVMEEILQLKAELCEEQLSSSTAEIHHSEADKEMKLKRKHQDNLSESPKKKPRVPRNKTKKNVQRNKKADDQISSNEDENINSGVIVNSSSSTSSEDSINNASEEILNSKGKARATRGAATDPQSLYARRRRERINERLKILQNLVPNGTKVDISTMLEEAVHYVKFLQLQIKLLSSDDHWMYAPIAYNGMDMGLYQKIVPDMWTRALSN